MKSRLYQRGYALGRYGALKLAAYLVLGGCCRRCRIGDKRVLQIDHVDGKGNAHRREVGQKGGPGLLTAILRDIGTGKRRYQLLCANCHALKTKEKPHGG